MKNLVDDEDEVTSLGRIPIKSHNTGVIEDIRIYRTCEIDDMSPSLKKIVTEYEREQNRKANQIAKYDQTLAKQYRCQKLEQEGKLKNIEDGVLIEIYVAYKDDFSVGDKLIFLGAQKGVAKEVIPEGDEPTSSYRPDEPIDAIASMVSFGNPELTPEYTNSFSLNFLKTWDNHTLSISSYYRPTTDVIQRIRYQGDDGIMYMTSENVAKNQRAGLELIMKDKLFRILDLTTTLNGYYYKVDGFSYQIMGQTVTGESEQSFSWDARLLASLMLPYDISLQATGNYRSRGAITQGYRRPNGSLDLGLRKSFLNKKFALSINWRDVFNSRQWENFTSHPELELR